MNRFSAAKRKCLTCDKLADTRGLCHVCYQNARRRIKIGMVTEDELIENKLLLPKFAAPTSQFGSMLAKRRRKEQQKSLQKCRTPECTVAKVFERGLCKVCYKAAARLVELRLTTWEALESSAPAEPMNHNRSDSTAANS